MASYGFETLTVEDFMKKIKKPNYEDLVSQEFKEIKAISLGGTFDHYSKGENATKNRYFNIPCWDHSRVILPSRETQVHQHSKNNWWSVVVTDKDSDSTYIHANFVDDYEDKNKYICCQGPKENTAGDLWKLIWENDVRIIVSLIEKGGNDEACYEYWVTEEGCQIIFGRYVVQTLQINERPGFITTQLCMIDVTSGESRQLTHYWYTGWPDHGAPTSLKEFMSFLSSFNQEQRQLIERATSENLPKPGPIVVHCLAGVGRSGTFCAINHVLSQLRKENAVSIQGSVMAVRKMRHSSVTTLEQYTFIYKVVEHVLLEDKDKKNLQ